MFFEITHPILETAKITLHKDFRDHIPHSSISLSEIFFIANGALFNPLIIYLLSQAALAIKELAVAALHRFSQGSRAYYAGQFFLIIGRCDETANGFLKLLPPANMIRLCFIANQAFLSLILLFFI